MTELLLIIKQIIIMFLMVALGYIVYKRKLIDDYSTKQVTDLVIYVVTPCIVITSFSQEFSMDKLLGFGIALILSFVSLAIGLILGKILLGKDTGLEQYGCGFSNAGFIGIPLVTSLLGVEYVFYVSAFIVAFNMLSWSYGIMLISGKSDFNLKKFLTNPTIVAIVIGFILFVTQITLPEVIMSTCSSVGSMNTPLGMIILGTYIAKEDILKIFTSKMGYYVSIIRLILVPVISIFIFKFVYVPFDEIKMVMLICASAPCGATLAMFSQMCGNDYSYGARIVSLSTLLCPITIVAMLTLANIIW